MARYFLEVSYHGSRYSGFQKQENANSIQAEIEKAFAVLQKASITLTGASRTDTGVHACQNFFHFDFDPLIHDHFLYKMNAILPRDIVAVKIMQVPPTAHCRFDATSRTYKYKIYQTKNPFMEDRAHYFPYPVDLTKLNEAAKLLSGYHDFTTFSKRNTQVKTFFCTVETSEWVQENELLTYNVKANRFLRGMVRGLTGTMLQVGRGKMSIDDLQSILLSGNCSQADFSVPAHGLFLCKVEYPDSIYPSP
ncbi:MAG: tRNA pseudouridine(38-40) synthase TruA [Chitinophagaceae bacterium]